MLPMILMFFSCNTNKLSENDLEWQPYKEEDKLIFESNKGELDTIQIKNVETHTNPDDPLAILPNTVQSLFVVGKVELLKLHCGKKGSKIEFKIRLGDNNLKYPGTMLYLNKGILDTLTVVEFCDKTSYKIKAEESRGNMRDRPFDLRYIYWSKEYGYLGLEFENNYIWKLKSFIRNGENIL